MPNPWDWLVSSAEGVPGQVEHYARVIGHRWKTGIETELTLGPKYADRGASPFKGGGRPKPKDTHKGGKPKGKPVTQVKLREQEIESSPMNQILQSVAKEYAVAQQAAQTAASGSLTAPATQGAWAQALQDLAGAPATTGMNPSAWLGQNLATAQQVGAPLQQAMSNYGSALQAQQGPILSNINALGQGLGAEDVTAGASAWLNALASHVTSNLSYGGTIPKAAVPSLPASVAQALQEAGGYGAAGSGSGLVPVSSLTVKGNTAKLKPGSAQAGLTISGGSVPAATPVPSG